jgi:hypothetical protein
MGELPGHTVNKNFASGSGTPMEKRAETGTRPALS